MQMKEMITYGLRFVMYRKNWLEQIKKGRLKLTVPENKLLLAFVKVTLN